MFYLIHIIVNVTSFLDLFFYAYEYFVCMYISAPCACLVPAEARKVLWIHSTEITDDCEPQCEC